MLPSYELHITLVGPSLPSKCSGESFHYQNLHMKTQRGLYHQLENVNPDVVVGELTSDPSMKVYVMLYNSLLESKVIFRRELIYNKMKIYEHPCFPLGSE